MNNFDPTGKNAYPIDFIGPLQPGDTYYVPDVYLGPYKYGYNSGNISDAYNNITTTVEISVTGALDVAKNYYKNAKRAPGQSRKSFKLYIAKKTLQMNKYAEISDKAFTALAYAGVALEVGEGIYNNCENGESFGKIAWDASVDVVVLGANTFASVAIGAAVGSLACPVLGTIAGALFGLLVQTYLDPREYMKSWVN